MLFNISRIDGSVDKAELKLRPRYHLSEPVIVNVHACNSTWTEDTIHYSNMPTYNTTPIDSVSVTSSYTTYSWRVTIVVQQALSSGNVSFAVTTNDSVSFIYRGQRNVASEYAPALDVIWNGNVFETTIHFTPGFTVFSGILILYLLYVMKRIRRRSMR